MCHLRWSPWTAWCSVPQNHVPFMWIELKFPEIQGQETIPSEDMGVLATPSPKVSAPSPKNEDRKSETEGSQLDQSQWETDKGWGWGDSWNYCWENFPTRKWLEDGSWTWTTWDQETDKTDAKKVHDALPAMNTVDRLDSKDLHTVADKIDEQNAKHPVNPAAAESAVPVPTEGSEGPGTEGNGPETDESNQQVEDQETKKREQAEKERIKKAQNARYNRFKRTLVSQNPR